MKFNDFWNQFKSNQSSDNDISQLQKIFIEEFSEKSDENLLVLAALTGLMAKVAYCDHKIDDKEALRMQEALQHWMGYKSADAKKMVQFALDNAQELAGTEDHLYSYPLSDALSEKERFHVLEVLFQVAASDGDVSHIESEELRLITKNLRLDHQHYIAARAKVLEHLSILKK